MRIRTFKTKKSKKYFFSFLSDDDQQIFRSIPYDTKEERDAARDGALENAKNANNFSQETADGKYYFQLKSGGNVIGESEKFDSRADADAAASQVQNLGSTYVPEAEAPAKKEEDYKTDGKSDDYKPLKFYQRNAVDKIRDGFDTFDAEGEHYFTYNMGSKIILISEGYSSAKGRDNGTKSVEKNKVLPERYDLQIHKNGKFYFNLKAGNRQEIATSIWFDSEGERTRAINFLQGKGGGGTGDGEGTVKKAGAVDTNNLEGIEGYRADFNIAAPPPPVEKAATDPAKPKKKRKKREKKPKAEKVYLKSGQYFFNDVKWQTFQSGGNKRYYFIFRTNEDKTLFFNSNVKGFDTEADADAALERVLKLAPSEGNYEGKVAKNGTYYFYVKDEDGKNVGKSFFYKDEAAMRDAVGLLIGRVGGDAEAEALRLAEEQRLAAEAAAAAEAEAKRKADEAARLAAEAEAKQKAEEAANAKALRTDDYLPCKAYEGDQGFTTFEKDGEHYFAYNNGQRKVLLRSEGYTTEKARDNGIESVKKNASLDERWGTESVLNDKYHFYFLKAGNHQEIARSCSYSDKAAMMSALSWTQNDSQIGSGAIRRAEEAETLRLAEIEKAKAAEVAAAAAAAAEAKRKADEEARLAAEAEAKRKADEEARLAAEAEAKRKADEEARLAAEAEAKQKAEAAAKAKALRTDDYLACEVYKGDAGFTKFEKAGEYYFAYNNGNNEVFLRSEGYTTEKARDNGIESVKKNAPIDERWGTESVLNDKYHFYYLKAGNHQEIARSCSYSDKASMMAAWGWVRDDSEIGSGSVKRAEAEALKLAETQKIEAEKAAAVAAAAAAAALAAANLKEEEEAKRKAEEEAKMAAEEKRKAAEAEAKRKAEEEVKRKEALAAANLKAEKEAKRKAEAEAVEKKRLAAEEEKKRKAAAAATAAAAAAALAAKKLKAEEEAKKVEAKRLKEAEAAKLAAAAPIKAKKVVSEKKATPPPPPPKKEVKVEKAAAAAVVEEGGLGGCLRKFWWLGLLLLIPLLWFLLRDCEACNSVPPVKDTTSEVVAPPPTPEPVAEPEPEPEPVKTALCASAASMNYPASSTAGKIAACLGDPNCNLPHRIVMKEATFPFNEARMSDKGKAEIKRMARVMNSCKTADYDINIYGNIANNEQDTYNGKYQDGSGITLSAIRARCLYKRLIDAGVDTGRMNFKGNGSSANNRDVIVEIVPRN